VKLVILVSFAGLVFSSSAVAQGDRKTKEIRSAMNQCSEEILDSLAEQIGEYLNLNFRTTGNPSFSHVFRRNESEGNIQGYLGGSKWFGNYIVSFRVNRQNESVVEFFHYASRIIPGTNLDLLSFRLPPGQMLPYLSFNAGFQEQSFIYSSFPSIWSPELVIDRRSPTLMRFKSQDQDTGLNRSLVIDSEQVNSCLIHQLKIGKIRILETRSAIL
jgi:hypothetical protein